MMRNVFDRRSFVRGVGSVTIAAGFAGCSSGGEGGGGDGTEDGHGGDGGIGGTETETETTTSPSAPPSSAPAEVEEHLSDTSNYDRVVDETGTGNVEVIVGAQGNDGNFAFEPAAVRVDAGTDVTWTGEGGQHNVVHTDGEFESELVESSENEYQYTFDEPGVYLYYCTPHRSLRMKGAVIVE